MFNQYDHTVNATIKFLKLLKVDVTSDTVNESLLNHPDWPSLLSISDMLRKWNVDNGAGSLDPSEIGLLPTPFIARTHDEKAPLAIVKDVTEQHVILYDKNFNRPHTIDKQKFISNWTGIYLIAEPNSSSGEQQFSQRRIQAATRTIIAFGVLGSISILLVILAHRTVSIYNISNKLPNTLHLYISIFLFIIGTIITSALLWYDIDKNNPLLKRVCTNIGKVNCNAILTSKHAKILPWLSWSEVGFIYFTGGLISFLLSNNKEPFVLSFISWLNILAAPFLLFSIYYQWRIAKQWCILCMAIQFVLALGALNIITNSSLFLAIPLDKSGISTIIISYIIPTFIWYYFKPIILKLHQSIDIKRQYLRLKFNPELFEALLHNQKQIILDKPLGITLGNPDAIHTIVKVCNTFCKPCSKAHPEIERLLAANSNLKANIIFITPDPAINRIVQPVQHILAVAEERDNNTLHKALNDWYLSENKNYESFAALYPLHSDLMKHNAHILAMNAWCEKEEIYSTPTIFINGYRIPNNYNIEDLHYLLMDLSSS